MKPSIEIVGFGGVLKFSTFPGGEESVQIHNPHRIKRYEANGYTVTIVGRLRSSQDVMRFFLTVNALRNIGITKLEAEIPYMPYARQDRICREGESNSLKVFADMLNSLNFDKVIYWDEHSPMTSAYIKNGINIPMYNFTDFYVMLESFKEDGVLVIPDAGARKRVMSLNSKLPCIQVMKVRDCVTGKVDIIEIFMPLGVRVKDKNLLIVDDICDGGRTFIRIAEELRKGWPQIKSLSLYVTHGIFSKGLNVFDNLIDHIYTTDSICTLKSNSRLTVMKRNP